jgi:hypothetical protein
MENEIKVRRGETINPNIVITADASEVLSGYTPYLEINFNELTGNTIIQGSAIINGYTMFNVSDEQNDRIPYVYQYEIYVKTTNETRVIIKDDYVILPNIKD